MPYIFDLTVKDNLWKEPILFMTAFAISMLSIQGFGKYFEVKNNWSRMRCRPEVMFFAWLFGIDPIANMEYCLENSGLQVKQGNLVNQLTEKIETEYGKIQKTVDTSVADVNNLNQEIRNMGTTMKNKDKNVATTIQGNILALKESMQKIIAGLVISKNMKNGILTTTKNTKLLTDNLNKSLAKLNK
jgi:hypothetical protein